ncbi:MAG: hypothetical protein ACK4E7_12905 [Permianibacter sp.]
MLLIHWRVEVKADKVTDAIGHCCDTDRGIEFSKALQRQTRDPVGEINPQWRGYHVLQLTATARLTKAPASMCWAMRSAASPVSCWPRASCNR